MPRLAKTRIVGTIAAIPLWMAWCGAATSQSTIANGQDQAGDVFASQQLDVVVQSSDTTATTTATGNSFVGSVVTGNLDVQSTQTVEGSVGAVTTVNVAADAGPSTVMTTAATGNAGDSVITGGGTLTGTYNQTTSGPQIDAESQLNGPDATTGDASMSVQAAANDQGFGAADSTVNTTVNQSNSSTVTANGGAVMGDVSGQGVFTATGAGNNVTGDSTGGGGEALNVTQSNTGDVTQGAMFVNLGNSEVTETAATATGNNANLTNSDSSLAANTNQDNESFVHAQAVETSFEYGGATVEATGVGNSVMLGNVGPSTQLTNSQVNGAQGVESEASFSSQGSPGWDAFVASTATGNAATAFACSACGGVMNVTNSQNNLGDVAASSSIQLANPARSARGVATAVGNSGTFYVTSPSGP